MQEVPSRNFLGLNVRDSGDKVKDNEFQLLQNAYQPTKGVFSRRFGSILDQSTGFDLASRVSGVWRHYGSAGERTTLYHCVPDTNLIPDNTADLTLTDVNDGLGNLFNGGAVETLRVCYSWVAKGVEQTYNSRTRGSFPAAGTFPIHASSNPAHQSIVLAATARSLQVTAPTFPTGVTAANIFVARGVNTDMVYVGSIFASAGTLMVREYIHALGVQNDVMDPGVDAYPILSSTGTLKPGTYYVTFGWFFDTNCQEGSGTAGTRVAVLSQKLVRVSGENNAIFVVGPQANSTNGATAAYVFVGTQPCTFMPHMVAGIVRSNPASQFNTLTISSIPRGNAATAPWFQGSDSNGVQFNHAVNSCYIGSLQWSVLTGHREKDGTQSRFQGRFGFLMAKDSSGNLYEIFPSRTWLFMSIFATEFSVYAGDNAWNVANGFPPQFHNFFQAPRTENDRFRLTKTATTWVQPFPYQTPTIDPAFCYQNGISYMVNGADLIWATDGYTFGQVTSMKAASQTLLPPPPKFLLVYQNSLVAWGAYNDNLIYQSNANNPQNWAVGGTGSAVRFATIGDALGSGGTALGIFTPQTEATSSPSSFLIAFKKNGTWMIPTIPDPTSNTLTGALQAFTGGPLQQVSGRVGCTAYRSVVQTPLGTVFVGQDGNVYIINAVREPQRIGTKIQALLSHLVGNDYGMRQITAVYHDNHYKLSYPSAAVAPLGPPFSTLSVNDSELWADLRTEEGSPITWVGPHIGRQIGPQIVLGGENDNLSRIYCDGLAIRTVIADSITTYADLAANGSAQAIALKIRSKKFRYTLEGHFKRIMGALADMYLDFSFTNNILFEGFADSYYQSINKNLSNGGAVWDVSLFDQSFFADAEWIGVPFTFGPDNLVGRTFEWQLSSSDQAPLILGAMVPELKAEKRRLV